MSKAGPNDWLSSTDVDIDGAASAGSSIKRLNVNAAVSGTSDATIVGPLGSRSAATSVSTTASTEDVARTGIVTETAPASDTASSGLNGRLQRIAQRLTTLLTTVLFTKSAGNNYETVAASQSAQVMGATGATGDYLSHVWVQPTTVAPGVVTVLDNAIEVAAYPGGTVGADLTPFPICIDAPSVSGAWKITTGANVKCTAFGRFT